MGTATGRLLPRLGGCCEAGCPSSDKGHQLCACNRGRLPKTCPQSWNKRTCMRRLLQTCNWAMPYTIGLLSYLFIAYVPGLIDCQLL